MQCHTFQAAKIKLGWWMNNSLWWHKTGNIFNIWISFTFVCTCVFRSYLSFSAIRCAIQKRLKFWSTVGELDGTYREPSQHFRGLYLQLVDTISSQLHTIADVRHHLIPRYVTAVPRPTTLQITLWIKCKSLFWTSRFKTQNSQHTGNWRLQYSHQVAWQIHSSWFLTWPIFS